MQMLTSLRRGALLTFASLALAGCGSDGGSEPDSNLANDIVSQISLLPGVTGSVTFHEEAAPAGNAGGPAANVTVLGSAIPGGSAQVQVTAPNAFQRIIVALADVDGYYEINLNSAVTSATLALALSENVDDDALFTRFAVGTSGGSLGAFDEATVAVQSVGTGDVQVSVSWNSNADVDLHVIDPSGEEIYYGNDIGENGELDLDSNAACDLDNVRNENITFAAPAPRGTYQFYVDLWSACSTTSTNWVVTVRRKGQATQTFTGSFGSTETSTDPVSFTY